MFAVMIFSIFLTFWISCRHPNPEMPAPLQKKVSSVFLSYILTVRRPPSSDTTIKSVIKWSFIIPFFPYLFYSVFSNIAFKS